MLKRFWHGCLTAALLLVLCGQAQARELRVALVSGQYNAEISCDDEFLVRDGSGEEAVLPKGKYFLHVEEDKLVLGAYAFVNDIAILQLEGRKTPSVNRRHYRGFYRAVRQEGLLLVNNVVDVEDYLCSVLPAKTMPVWPDEVIKAQAAAARSYALYMAELNAAAPYDLSANDKELKYEGTGKRVEKPAVSKLVHATAGEYLEDKYGSPVCAVTTSSSGGRTEAGGHYYLPCLPDEDSDAPEFSWERRFSPYLVQGLLEQRGYVTGTLQSIRLSPLKEQEEGLLWGSDRTEKTGRVKYLIFSGDAGTVQVSGEELAELLDLDSTLFDIDTGVPVPETLKIPINNYWGAEIGHKDIPIKINEAEDPVWKDLRRSYHFVSGSKEEKLLIRGSGRGPGIGLSGWGARGMYNANDKLTYKDILAYYYPGTYLRR